MIIARPKQEDVQFRALSRPLLELIAKLNLPARIDIQAKLFATMGFVEASLGWAHRLLLIPLGMHERFVEVRILEMMAKSADQAPLKRLWQEAGLGDFPSSDDD